MLMLIITIVIYVASFKRVIYVALVSTCTFARTNTGITANTGKTVYREKRGNSKAVRDLCFSTHNNRALHYHT